MNDSGTIWPWLQKHNVKAEQMLVIHDELELPFGTVKIKVGGSARGHNGLRSLIAHCGNTFSKLSFGIGRPTDNTSVADYVLARFNEPHATQDEVIEKSIAMIYEMILQKY